MKKRSMLYIVMIMLSIFFITGCSFKSKTAITDAQKFKNEYEAVNGKNRVKNGEEQTDVMRTVSIDSDNPIVYSSLEEINTMIKEKKTCIVYTGFPSCPWCRSLVETMINTAKSLKIDNIYYVDVRPNDNDSEELRDIFKTNDDGAVYLEHSGTDAYHEFINSAKDFLKDYTYGGVNLDNTKWSGTKRLGAPNFILIEHGEVTDIITGISEHQENGYQELTDEMKADMTDKFTCFFNKYLECSANHSCNKENMC